MRQPVQIIRYSNRIEFRNPGHSLKPDDRLGEPGSISRNEKIAAIFHETGFAETKGSGIRVVRELMRGANLTLPFFESDREADTFTATVFTHHLLGEDDIEWLGHFREYDLNEDEAKALIMLRELGALNNAVYRDINQVDTLRASGHLRRLRDCGILEQKGRASKTYYVPGPVFLASLDDDANVERMGEPTDPAGHRQPLSTELTPLSTELVDLGEELPKELKGRIDALKKRVPPGELDSIVYDLCRWRPLDIKELASLLNRKPDYLRRSARRLMATGRLDYVYPDNPTHPEQKYRAV